MTTRVAVCALTMQRPDGLASLLDGLSALEVDPSEIEVHVVIVDNDAAGRAGPLVAARAGFPWPLVYEVEPERGIPIARNRAARAADGADFVAFIDDDEVPDPGWLSELVRVQRATRADVVTGPVIPIYDPSGPAWVVRGGFFDRPRFATGHEMEWATTSNVLISSSLLRGAPFDVSMRYTGGSDTHFFMRVHRAGARIVWADDAVVSESIPVSRMTAGWLVRREFRRGNTLTLCLLDLADSPWRRARRLARGCYLLGRGALGLVPGAFRARVGIVRALREAAFGAGLVAGLAGTRYEEYRSLHGS